jgi:hypothetical protein
MRRHFTHKRIAATIVFVTTCLASVWLFRPIEVLTNKPTPRIEERAIVVDESEEPQQLIDIFSDETLFYKGYDVRKLTDKVSYGHNNEVEVSYAVLQKYDLTFVKFDGVYFVEGNSTEFGLFDLFGNGSQQLIVSQTVPRGGRHWVVDGSSGVRVLFDSWDYSVGREEFYVIDVDKDGIYEISLPFTAFYAMQDKMYIGEIPLPEIVFKYDAKAWKYVPANHLFPEYTLRGIEQDIEQLHTDDGSNYLSKRLDILLRYIFAHRSEQGWEFFNREYQHPDKQEIKNRIVRILKQSL